MDDPLLDYARRLEEADLALARSAAEIDGLRREVAELRARASHDEALLARLPAAREAAADAVRTAEAELGRRMDEVEAAEHELALAEAERRQDEERVAAARRAVVRTRDAAATAEARLDRARLSREELERDAERAAEEAPQLERQAQALAEEVSRLPRVSAQAGAAPAPGLAGAVAWTARAEAALFVARSGLDAERERVAREANELGASALGEHLGATSVSLVRERLERR